MNAPLFTSVSLIHLQRDQLTADLLYCLCYVTCLQMFHDMDYQKKKNQNSGWNTRRGASLALSFLFGKLCCHLTKHHILHWWAVMSSAVPRGTTGWSLTCVLPRHATVERWLRYFDCCPPERTVLCVTSWSSLHWLGATPHAWLMNALLWRPTIVCSMSSTKNRNVKEKKKLHFAVGGLCQLARGPLRLHQSHYSLPGTAFQSTY